MDVEKIMTGITANRQKIHEEHMWNDPVALSDVMTRLGTYNAYLADHLAPLHKEATDTAYALYIAVKNGGGSTSAADHESRGGSTQERAAYEGAKNVYNATANLINIIQSRLKVIENQRRQEGI